MHRSFFARAIKSLVFVLALGASAEWAPLNAMSGFGCSGVAGSVIFRDTFYGVLTGGLIASVYVLAREEWKDVGKRVSTGAVIGSVSGFGLGIAEIMLRDCHEPARPGMAAEDRAWHSGFIFTGASSTDRTGGIAATIETKW